jgi:probable HAF family extracellular repeat protein
LSKGEEYAKPKSAVAAQIGFLRGLCYDGLDQADEAKASFKSVADHYPETDCGFMAKQMLTCEPLNLGPPVEPSATARGLDMVFGTPVRPFTYFVEGAAISGDGKVMIGEQVMAPHFIFSGAPTIVNLFRWTKADGARRIGVIHVPVTMEGLDYGTIIQQTIKISADGSVVAGSLAGTNSTPAKPHAFIWTKAGGMQDLGEKSIYPWTDAEALSSDGSVLVGGYIMGVRPDLKTGFFRWTQRSGFEDLGNLGAPADRMFLRINGVSNDGAVVTGSMSVRGVAGFQVFRWTQFGGFQILGTFGGRSANVLCASPDGLALVAVTEMADKTKKIVRWTQSGGPKNLGVIGDLSAWATCASEDGSIVVGDAYIPKSNLRNSVPFRWTPSSGLQYVCELGPAWTTSPVGVNSDASRILLNVNYMMDCQQGAVVIPVDSMFIPLSHTATAWVFYKSFICDLNAVSK